MSLYVNVKSQVHQERNDLTFLGELYLRFLWVPSPDGPQTKPVEGPDR